MSVSPAYAALKAHRLRVHHLEHLQAIATWDRMTQMPPAGAPARASAQGELAALLQRMQADPALDDLLAGAGCEPLDAQDAANLMLMRRERTIAQALPEALVQRRVQLVCAASQAWEEARRQDDWTIFAPALAPLVECVRDCAKRIGDRMGLSPYDALLDGHDRGLRADRVDELFGGIAAWLPDVVEAIVNRQAGEAVVALAGPFDAEGQSAVCVAIMDQLGFDFTAGRLDLSVHPFTGGVPEDVRLTTRLDPDDLLSGLLGVVHETGHGRYQAGLPRDWLGQPLGEACSASMHEAQALSFERQLARTPAFVARLSAALGDTLGAQPAFAADNLLRLMTRVRPGHIRIDADEATYPAHVVLRTEIEAAIIGGAIGVEDVPAWWDERMEHLLGLAPAGAARGPLQDIHWSQGMFGYFPAYLLGAMIAAQLAGTWREREGDELDVGRFPEWLGQNVWSKGAESTTEQLVAAVTGRPLSDISLRNHLQRRYLA